MKIVLSLFTAFLFVSSANAQHGNAHSAFGIKGGVNIYSLHNDEGGNDGYDARVGFNAGVMGHLHLAPHIAMQPEIVYSYQGTKYELLGEDANVKLGYINVPVMFQYMFDHGFRIQAGPQVGFLTTAKTEYGNTNTDIKDNLKSVDFGIGAGFSYVSPHTGLGLDARYNFGLTNINESDDVKTTNRGAQIGLFYLIHR